MNSPANPTRDMLGRTETVSLAEARELLQKFLPPCSIRKVSMPIEETLGRICAEDIRSPENLPRYPRSTMDGYAVRAQETFGASENLPVYLEVSGEVLMGEFPDQGPKPGACHRIATGGLLPPGTDAVVMLEHTVAVDNNLIEVVQPVAAGANIIDAGEDIATADILLATGHRIRPHDIGLLAGVGIETVQVYRKVRVGIISTGDEIVPHNQIPPPGKIRDMNSVSLAAQVRALGGEPAFYGIANDNQEELTSMMRAASRDNDIVLLSGSSSVGTRDLGETVIDTMGSPGIILHGVSVKPGKPVIIARAGDIMIFGLPGHPVSTAVSFDLFVRPAIIHQSGITADGLPRHRTMNARLMRNINSASGRTDFIRVQVTTMPGQVPEAHPILGKSSALSTMVKAHGYLEIEEKLQGLHQGELVEIKLFD